MPRYSAVKLRVLTKIQYSNFVIMTFRSPFVGTLDVVIASVSVFWNRRKLHRLLEAKAYRHF